MHLQDIQIRDPFVLPLPERSTYVLFGSTDKNIWSGPGVGFDAYRSRDLVTWEGPFPAFRPTPGFRGRTQFWAPEVHRVGDRFAMLATFATEDARPRASHLLWSSDPLGPYLPEDEPLTPPNWACLDATLHHDAEGKPWLVFCQEWLQVHDGALWAQRLDTRLRPVARPVFLFHASEARWTAPLDLATFGMPPRDFPCHVTDGPFLHRSPKGELRMLWSSASPTGYALGVSTSASGTVLGPWIHADAPLVAGDGGHGMVFQRFDGTWMLAFHRPNVTPHERAVFAPLVETVSGLALRS